MVMAALAYELTRRKGLETVTDEKGNTRQVYNPKKAMEYWVNDKTTQTILDGYFIFEKATELDKHLKKVLPIGNYALVVSGSTSPRSPYRGLAIAGKGESDIDMHVVLGDECVTPIDTVNEEIKRFRSRNYTERQKLTKSAPGSLSESLGFSYSNVNWRTKEADCLRDKMIEAARKLREGKNIELDLHHNTRSMPPAFLVDYWLNPEYVHDGIGLKEYVQKTLGGAERHPDIVADRKKLKHRKILRLKSNHFSKLTDGFDEDGQIREVESLVKVEPKRKVTYQATLDDPYMDPEIRAVVKL
jgi:hypothetical protein